MKSSIKITIAVAAISFMVAISIEYKDYFFLKASDELVVPESSTPQHIIADKPGKMPLSQKSENTKQEISTRPQDAAASDFRDSLAVIAIFSKDDDDRSSCVIYHESKGAFRYKEGEEITNNIYLKEIYADYVIIEKSGVDYLLKLIGTITSENPDLGTSSTEISKNGSENKEEEDESIKDVRMGAISYLNLTPVKINSPDGYIVGDNFPKDIARIVDILPGDIVTHINGYAVGDESNDTLAWRSFQSSGFATITVRRDDQEIAVYYRNQD